MKQFLRISLASAQQQIVYRATTYFLFVASMIELSLLYYFWKAAQGSLADDRIFGAHGIGAYIILAGLLAQGSLGFNDQFLGRQVRSGAIVYSFVKPVDIQILVLANQFGTWLTRSVMTTIPVLLLANAWFGFPRPYDLVHVLIFIISWLLGVLVAGAFDFCIGLITFRTVEDFFISQAKLAIMSFFSGAIIPLRYLGEPWISVANLLPFGEIISVPVRIYLGAAHSSELMYMLLKQVIWVVLLLSVGRIGWKWAVKDVSLHAT